MTVYRQIGIKSGLANTLGNLGEACYKLGEYAEARQHLQAALQMAQEIGAVSTSLKVLTMLASLLAQAGQPVQSLELLAFITHQPAIASASRERAAALFAELAADLPSEMVAAAEARGQARELDEVVAGILGHKVMA